MNIVYVENEFIEEQKAKISLEERAFLFGDGIFTTLLIEDSHIYFLEDHLKRLLDHASYLGIEYPKISHDLFKKLVFLNQATKGKWRLKIFITSGKEPDLSLPFRKGNVILTLKPLQASFKDQIKLIVYPDPVVYPLAKIKPLAYINRFWFKQFALNQKADDCILKNHKNFILDASFSNIFWINKKTLFYPDPELEYLFGITLKHILIAAQNIGLQTKPVKENEEVLLSSFVFLSSAIMGPMPVSYLETHKLPEDLKLQKALKDAYQKICLEKSFSCV